jgi:thymidylate kinase
MGFVAIEGGMCAGKTTVSQKLESMGWNRQREYFELVQPSEKLELEGMSPLERFTFFLKIDERRNLSFQSGRNVRVVADRSIFSILATEYALWKTRGISDMNHIATFLRICNPLIPDLVVFLEVSDEERAFRFAKRLDPGYAVQFIKPNFNYHFQQFFNFLPQGYVQCLRNDRGSVEATAEMFSELANDVVSASELSPQEFRVCVERAFAL